MANLINLTVVKCTPSSKGGSILKLQNKDTKQVSTAFGITSQASQQTFYLKVASPMQVGFVAPLDTDMFAITELPFNIPAADAQPAVGIPGQLGYIEAKPATSGELVMLKWLFLK